MKSTAETLEFIKAAGEAGVSQEELEAFGGAQRAWGLMLTGYIWGRGGRWGILEKRNPNRAYERVIDLKTLFLIVLAGSFALTGCAAPKPPLPTGNWYTYEAQR